MLSRNYSKFHRFASLVVSFLFVLFSYDGSRGPTPINYSSVALLKGFLSIFYFCLALWRIYVPVLLSSGGQPSCRVDRLREMFGPFDTRRYKYFVLAVLFVNLWYDFWIIFLLLQLKLLWNRDLYRLSNYQKRINETELNLSKTSSIIIQLYTLNTQPIFKIQLKIHKANKVPFPKSYSELRVRLSSRSKCSNAALRKVWWRRLNNGHRKPARVS